MQILSLVVLVIASCPTIIAQLADLPQCSLNCMVTALSSDGCSDLTDFACHCEKYDALWSSVEPCVTSACSSEDVKNVEQGVASTCESVGKPIGISSIAASATSVIVLPDSATRATPTSAASVSDESTTLPPKESLATQTSQTLTSEGSSTLATVTSTSPSSPGETGSSPPPKSAGGSKTNVGAIVGGVVGGLAVLCVAGVAVFYIRRRHPREPQQAEPQGDLSEYKHSGAPQATHSGMGYVPDPAPAYGPAELAGREGGYPAHELPATKKE